MAQPGADTPLHAILAFKQDLYHCSDCNYCVDATWAERGIDHVCATIEHHSPALSYSGRGYIAAARALLEGQDLNLEVLAERVFSCTTCGNCEQVCPIGLRPAQVGQALREELLAREVMPAAITALRRGLQRDGNANGVAAAARARWAEGLALADTAPVLYLPGCAAATLRPNEARAVVRILSSGGKTVATLGVEDSCCGSPQRELGATAEANAAATLLQAKARNRAASEVVTSGFECLQIWTSAPYQDLQVKSFPDWLHTQLEQDRIRFLPKPGVSLPTAVACLDTCQQRRLGQLKPAGKLLRDILRRVGCVPLNEGAAPRFVVCCGAAGGMPAMQPESSRRMAHARAAQLAAMGGTVVVGLDPRCVAHVAQARDSALLPVYALAEFLLEYFDVRTA